MRKLLFNILLFCAIGIILFATNLVSGKLIAWILVPIVSIFIFLTFMQVKKEYNKLRRQQDEKSPY
ncbi:hypothetical protein [Kurthia sibirica]|uniref:Uncharacterized protein n=1 Tax=Kurthia sibirica TaxID=202750 RepID=A0A2U3ALX0_9BACL|nr:hypothetical protein [Kurthia sibirica]PWI25515.1 hypothetical protein DEX24_07870 [Kurthia sibirica]GEK33993.1 hypothetical protein KSI01_15260 [Kurthia sibirica]